MTKTLKEKTFWLNMLKYFFEITMTSKSNQSNDGLLIVETWKNICEMFSLNYRGETDEKIELDDIIMETQNCDQAFPKENLKELIEYFLTASLDFVNNLNPSNKNSDNVKF